MINRILFLALLLFSLPAQAETKVVQSIHYGSNKSQVVDVYQPDTCVNRTCPVVMWVHGGGWRHGDMQGAAATSLLNIWAEQGIVMVGVNYRLSPEVQHPAHVQDVAAAINWVHKNIAQYGGDAERVSLLGHSAGAHLVALVATNPRFLAAYGLDPKTAIANVFPIDTASFDLTNPSRVVSRMIKIAFGTDEAVLRDASPVWNVQKGGSYPPFIIAANKVRDDAVTTSEELQTKLREAGVFADFIVVDYPGLGQLKAHGQIAKDLQDMDNDVTHKLIGRVLGTE